MQGVAGLLLEAKLDCQYAPFDYLELACGPCLRQDICDQKKKPWCKPPCKTELVRQQKLLTGVEMSIVRDSSDNK